MYASIYGSLDRPTQMILLYKVKKDKGRYNSSWELHLRATGRHLPYGITQC